MRLALASLPFLALVLPAPVQAEPAVVDSGSYRILFNDRAFGTEWFAFLFRGDSLVVSSNVTEIMPGDPEPDTLRKSMGIVLKADDFDLRSYESHQSFHGQRLHRGLSVHDTLITSYLQVNDRGQGDQLIRPPGRLFIMDPQVFALYDLMCRNLHSRVFDRRELLLFVLGFGDTTRAAIATNLGPETIRWGSRPVQARKVRVDDGQSEFFLWISPNGQMLRLSQPAYGLLVERNAPPVRKAAARPRSGG